MNQDHISYAIFWGCLILNRLPWIELAARKVLPRLGVTIVDLPFSCCPDPIATKAMDHQSWLALAARNLTLAEEKQLNILTLCSGCFETLRMAQEELKKTEKRETVNRILSKVKRRYQGTIQVYHLIEWLYNIYGPDKLKAQVVHPISLRVATHTGCHFSRPSDILQTDDPIYPQILNTLCESIGLESVEYPDQHLCCGVGASLTNRHIAAELIQRKRIGATKAGAQALVAHCPSCIQSYDFGQKVIAQRENPLTPVLPVFHYLELLGIAMGINRNEFDFDEHEIPVSDLNL